MDHIAHQDHMGGRKWRRWWNNYREQSAHLQLHIRSLGLVRGNSVCESQSGHDSNVRDCDRGGVGRTCYEVGLKQGWIERMSFTKMGKTPLKDAFLIGFGSCSVSSNARRNVASFLRAPAIRESSSRSNEMK